MALSGTRKRGAGRDCCDDQNSSARRMSWSCCDSLAAETSELGFKQPLRWMSDISLCSAMSLPNSLSCFLPMLPHSPSWWQCSQWCGPLHPVACPCPSWILPTRQVHMRQAPVHHRAALNSQGGKSRPLGSPGIFSGGGWQTYCSSNPTKWQELLRKELETQQKIL